MTTELPPYDTAHMSMLERMALLPTDERDLALNTLTPADVASPDFFLRPSQLEALRSSAWLTALITGRGFGKTKVLSNWVIEKARVPATRIHLVGRTVADVRDVMVQGESGILAESPDHFKPDYTPSLRRIIWPNGSIAITFSADSPSQLRGPQSDYTACDEIATWKHLPDDSGATAWDNVLISTRLGTNPQIMIATTPKRTPTIRDLIDQATREPDRVRLISGSMFENRANLSPDYIRTLLDMYEGSALERQELYGELVLTIDGALWRDEDVPVPFTLSPDTAEDQGFPLRNFIRLVAVDPGVTTGGDATGIVVVYVTPHKQISDRRAFVVEDLTDPSNLGTDVDSWAAVVADAQARHSAPGNAAIVVVEKNQGQELLNSVLHQQNPHMPIASVNASRNKAARAEAVVLAYRRGRVEHADDFPELVDEMTSWEPDARWSPNRMDALVWGLRVGLIDDAPIAQFKSVRVMTEAARRTRLGILGEAWRDMQSLGSHREGR